MIFACFTHITHQNLGWGERAAFQTDLAVADWCNRSMC